MIILLALFPLAIAAVWLTPRAMTHTVFLTAAVLAFVTTIFFMPLGDGTSISWWPLLGLNIDLRVTPLNTPLLWLNAIVLLSTAWIAIRPPKGQVTLLLLAALGVSLSFLSHNILLYFLGFEMAVLPFFLLVRRDGGDSRREAALYFLGYSALAGIFLLAGSLLLVTHHVTTFSATHLSHSLQLSLYGILLVTWAIKLPLWPFHLWLPKTHGEAPTPVSMYLSGTALKVAPYGFILFTPLFAQASTTFRPALALWGAVTVVMGAILAFAQSDYKKMVAQSSVASMGYVMVALASGTPSGQELAILVMVGHGLASPLLFLTAHHIQKRLGTRNLDAIVGLYQKDPQLVRWITLGAFCYMGIPGLALFPGEFGIVVQTWQQAPITAAILLIGILVMAAVWIRVLARMRFGSPETHSPLPVPPQEWLHPFLLGIPLVLLGINPHWWIQLWHWGGL